MVNKRYICALIPASMDTDMARYTLSKGRYSDKQTTQLSFPLQPPMYRFDTKLTVDSCSNTYLIYLTSLITPALLVSFSYELYSLFFFLKM